MSTPTKLGTPDPDGENFDNVVPLRRTVTTEDSATEVTAASSAPGAEIERKVFDGEIVAPQDSAALDRRLSAQRVRAMGGQVVRVIRTSDQTARLRYRLRQSPRDARTLLWYSLRGHWRFVVKAWTWATYGDLRADVRAARLAGDVEARRTAQEMLRADAHARWARLAIVLRRLLVTAAVLAPIALVLVIAGVLFERSEMWAWLASVYDVLDIVGAVLSTVWSALLVAVPVGVLVASVFEGRDRKPGAGFLVQPNRDDADSYVDERMISQALAHLGIAPLDKFFKSGGQLHYSVGARVDGDGTYAQIRLPMGVTAEMVAGQRKKLAGNLGRASLETWPTEGDEDAILDLWVADKGKLGRGAGEWPMLHDGQVDLFEGVPFGLTQRGLLINAPLFEANWLVGGRPGQGKSAALRTAMLGAALDPTAELWAFVMGESPDFDPFRPRLTRYAMGMDDSVAEAALQALRDMLAEMERRGKVLGEMGTPKTSRKLADKRGLGLHPLVCAIDEVHELFQHPTYGEEAGKLAIRLIKRGRKYGVILLLATQSPTKDSIPREVTRNISVGIAFAVADHVANDGLLGAGKYKQGIRATDLRMKTDRGTAVAVGLTDNVFELVRVFYIAFEDGRDDVTPVINRAMQLIADAGRDVPVAAEIEAAPELVDHLADIATVLREDKRVRTQVLLARLAEHRANEYEDWTFQDLKAALADAGVEVAKSNGHSVVRADDIAAAIAERDEDGADDEDTDGDEDAGK
ncbi:FtsK/SpoIIIE domain-containing protein [Lentzea sp. NPDC051208]|uniref:FtsK/SpoIIIE domain-containing protein n=1 Tax=Lentzea sp. NPDC051208 TaxID=3154642 RepID=UPI0034409BD9